MADNWMLKAVLSANSESMVKALKSVNTMAKSTRKYLLDVGKSASNPSGLRGLTNVLVDATAAAQAMGRLVDLKMLRAAWGDLGAMQ